LGARSTPGSSLRPRSRYSQSGRDKKDGRTPKASCANQKKRAYSKPNARSRQSPNYPIHLVRDLADGCRGTMDSPYPCWKTCTVRTPIPFLSIYPLLTGNPIARLENMEGKKMAIDSSIWLYQFQATMRDKDGRGLVNAHVLGFLRRICKLLFYGIRPVFVFDGGAPVLKKMTIVRNQVYYHVHSSLRPPED
jgi:XPG N-terminal domain